LEESVLVYSNSLWLDESSGVGTALDAIAEWLSRKTRQVVKSWRIKQQSDLSMKDGSHIQSWAAAGDFPILHAVRYTHRDSKISGRQWVTEIGLRLADPSSPIQCTLLLRTNEISPRVSATVEVTRPLVLQEILKRCRASDKTPGLRINVLSETTSKAFRDRVSDTTRDYAIIAVSPTKGDTYLVDCARLLSLVIGLADVFVIPPEADTFAISDLVGNEYAAWLGAVNVIFPPLSHKHAGTVPTRRLLPEYFERLAANGIRPEADILSVLVHRSNLPNSWRHISPDLVREHILRQELHHQREEAQKTGSTADYVKLLEEVNLEQEHKLDEMTKEGRAKDEELKARDAEIDQLEFDKTRLQQTLEQVTTNRPQSEASLSRSTLEAIVATIKGSPTPLQCLEVIAGIFPDRLVVTEFARKSAENSDSFRQGMKALHLLLTLTTDYWTALASGSGDAAARKYLGSAYAAKESETVEMNRRARQARTFSYNGEAITVSKHLKIGVKDSVAETLRIYFEWDPQAQAIVIFHCGQHPPHN
jgi:hypothetical protein